MGGSTDSVLRLFFLTTSPSVRLLQALDRNQLGGHRQPGGTDQRQTLDADPVTLSDLDHSYAARDELRHLVAGMGARQCSSQWR